ncbi:MAG: lipid A-modifier LpxR family protein [Flavobacterium sp.]
MKRAILIRNIVLAAMLLFLCDVKAQGKGFQVLLTTENDFLAISNKDENYTGSIKIEAQFPELIKWFPFFKYKKPEKSLTIQRIGIGGTAYTPQNLAASEPITNDRPYASLMFLNFGNTSYNLVSGAVLQSEIVIGAIGTSLPGNAQSYIHKHHWFGSTRDVPMGWDNQIGYKGSFIFNYNARIEYPVFPGFNADAKCNWLQLRIRGGAELGNYTANLKGGVKINVFNLNAGIMQDYSPSVPGTFLKKADNIFPAIRMNVFIIPEIRTVAYNSTLEGLLFSDHSIYKIPHSDITRVVFDVSAGVNLLIKDRFYLKYAMYGRSREYSGGKNFHYWGGISLGYSPARWNR